MSAASVSVVVMVSLTLVVALAGWLLGGARKRPGRYHLPEGRVAIVASTTVVVSAALAAVAAPLVGVLWAFVLLNFTVGRREAVPFSTFPMYARPQTPWWSLHLEGPDGALVTAEVFGLDPVSLHKRFAREVSLVRAQGIDDQLAARLSAARALSAVVEAHRPARGPWSKVPVTIVLLDYVLEGGGVRTTRSPLIETRP